MLFQELAHGASAGRVAVLWKIIQHFSNSDVHSLHEALKVVFIINFFYWDKICCGTSFAITMVTFAIVMILIFSIVDDLEKQRDIEIQEENEERRAEALRKTIEYAKLLEPAPAPPMNTYPNG